MQVPCKFAYLGIYIQRYHQYLVLHAYIPIIHLFQYKMKTFFLIPILCIALRGKQNNSETPPISDRQ